MMRTEQEIRRAIKHIEEALPAAVSLANLGDTVTEGAMRLQRDMLRWCVGEQSRFEAFMRQLDQVDEDRAKAEGRQ